MPHPSSLRARFSSLSRGSLAFAMALVGLASVALPTTEGCAAKAEATKPPTRCTPGNYVFCRCQNREEGTKLCNDDGDTFGKCEPCESDTNPELPPDEDPYPRPELDGGIDGSPGGARCGDKIVQDGEACDDGNTNNDDGCDTSCKLSGSNPQTSRACPGLDVHVWSAPVTWTGTTVGAPFNFQADPTCGSATGDVPTSGANGPDRVLQVTAHKTGTMTVTASDVDYNAFLYVSDVGCTMPKDNRPASNKWLTCANKTDGVGNETMSFPVTAGKVYAVFVDGAGIGGGQQGLFRLTLSIK